ncbi:MAG TPA: hypothetical protein VMT58_03305, partial [Candidatus Binataceae bacterium]|nr:hypothetical protein [Candidatus Binataceae bacterium]
SRQLSLWNQMGSRALLGNLLVIPVEDALLYVEPLYIRAENGQLPELQRVVAAYSDRVVMGDTLGVTLASLFTNAVPPTSEIAGTAPPVPMMLQKGSAGEAGLQSAAQHYSRALAALRAGDWTEFGSEMKQLGDALGQPPSSDHQ